jgi:hypothetical protein
VAGEGEKCSLKCAGKDASKCCAESEGKVVLTAEKAEALAKEIKLESCPGKSGEILASVLPGLKCKDTLAKLTADVKSKECSKEAANLILAAVKEYGSVGKKPAVLTAEKAEALAKEIKAESCPGKSGEILASVLPGLKCQDTLAKLTADVKSKECSKEAANLILAAVKQYGSVEKKPAVLTAEKAEALAKEIKAEGCPVKSGEILASVLPGLKCKDTLAKLTADVKSKECSTEAANLILAAVKQYGACDEKACCEGAKGKVVALNSDKALLIAAQIRSEICPVKSSEILASALPELKCQETLTKLLSEIKAKGCEKEASELILAAQAKLTPKPEAQKKN